MLLGEFYEKVLQRVLELQRETEKKSDQNMSVNTESLHSTAETAEGIPYSDNSLTNLYCSVSFPSDGIISSNPYLYTVPDYSRINYLNFPELPKLSDVSSEERSGDGESKIILSDENASDLSEKNDTNEKKDEQEKSADQQIFITNDFTDDSKSLSDEEKLPEVSVSEISVSPDENISDENKLQQINLSSVQNASVENLMPVPQNLSVSVPTGMSASNPIQTLSGAAKQTPLSYTDILPQSRQADEKKAAFINEQNMLVKSAEWVQQNIFEAVGNHIPVLGTVIKMIGNVLTGAFKTIGHLFDGKFGNALSSGMSWVKDSAIIGGSAYGIYKLGKELDWWHKDKSNGTVSAVSDISNESDVIPSVLSSAVQASSGNTISNAAQLVQENNTVNPSLIASKLNTYDK